MNKTRQVNAQYLSLANRTTNGMVLLAGFFVSFMALFYALPDPVRRFVRHLTHRRPASLIAHTPLADITFPV